MRLALAVQTPEVQPTVPVALLAGTFEEKLAKAARFGADGIELMPADPAQLDASFIRSSLEANGLQAAAVGSGAVRLACGLALLHADPAVAAQAKSRLHDLVDLAAAVGAPLVTIGGFRGHISEAKAGPEQLAAILRTAASHAEERGIRLVLEPLNRYETDLIRTADEGLAFVEQIGHPAVGLLLDTYHMNIEESSWAEPFRRLMAAGRLWHVHIGDSNRLPPGRGMADFSTIVATLRETGYTGYLSAELLAQPDPDTAARETLTYMRTLLAG